MSAWQIPRAVFDSIRAHGEETYPDECCGVLLGTVLAAVPAAVPAPVPGTVPGESSPARWRIVMAVRATNARTDSARNRYAIAPLELIQIEREARRQGLGIAGFYHSHPDHPAHWSATDLEEAHWLGCCYLITEIAQGKAAETQAFLLAGRSEEEKHFVQQPIQPET